MKKKPAPRHRAAPGAEPPEQDESGKTSAPQERAGAYAGPQHKGAPARRATRGRHPGTPGTTTAAEGHLTPVR